MKPLSNMGLPLLVERRKQGLSIRELAEKSKVSVTTIARIERGLTRPTRFTKAALAEALAAPLENLFPRDEP